MTARSLLLKLISCLLFILPSAFAINLTIEDFEDVSDWSISDDLTSFAVSTTQVFQGTYSGKATFTTNAAASGEALKIFSAVDFSPYTNISIWAWLNEDDFTYDNLFSVSFTDGALNACANLDFSITKAETTDEAWSQVFSSSISSWTFCNTSDITRAYLTTFTEDNPVPFSVYFDAFNLHTPDSCLPPVSGDMTIINGDNCKLNEIDSITGNLIILDGALQIQASGALTISGGYINIYPGSNLTILSGGQING